MAFALLPVTGASLVCAPYAAYAARPLPTILLYSRSTDSADDVNALVSFRKELRADGHFSVITFDPEAGPIKRAASEANHSEWLTAPLTSDSDRLALARAMDCAFYIVVGQSNSDRADLHLVETADSARTWDFSGQKSKDGAHKVSNQATSALASPAPAAIVIPPLAPVPTPEPPMVIVVPPPTPEPIPAPPIVVVPPPTPAPIAAPPIVVVPPPTPAPIAAPPIVVVPPPTPAPIVAPAPVVVTPTPAPTPVIVTPTPAPTPVIVTPIPKPKPAPVIITTTPKPKPTPEIIAPPVATSPTVSKPTEATSPGGDDLAPVKDMLSHGDAAMQRGDIVEAISFYRESINGAPLNALPRLKLAKAYLEGGLRDKALDEARRAVQISPNDASLQEFLNSIDAESGNSEGGVYRYQGLVDRNPKDPAMHLGLADALWNHGDLQQAEAEYKTAQSLSAPTDHAATAHLARLYAAQARYDDSLALLKSIGSDGYALAIAIVQSRADALNGQLGAAHDGYKAGRTTREAFYDSLKKVSVQSQALADFVAKLTPPPANRISHLHRMQATDLMAQEATVLMTFLETGNTDEEDKANRLDRAAQTEMLTAHAAEQKTGLKDDLR